MSRSWLRPLPGLTGVAVMLAGLLWDARVHALSAEAHHEVSLLDFSNPGHVVFALGLILTASAVTADFGLAWITAHPRATPWRRMLAPAVVVMLLGVIGLATVATMARTG